jgi:hypothetical protein
VAIRRRFGLAPAATVVALSRAAEGFRQRRNVPTRGCRALTPWCRAGLEAKKKGLLQLDCSAASAIKGALVARLLAIMYAPTPDLHGLLSLSLTNGHRINSRWNNGLGAWGPHACRERPRALARAATGPSQSVKLGPLSLWC